MKTALLIALGGALGALSRWLLSAGIDRLAARSSQLTHLPVAPVGTLCANILGSLLIGIFFGFTVARELVSEPLRWFLVVGFLGSFTTFSTFSLHTHELLRHGHTSHAIGNIVLNLLLTLAAVSIGFFLSQRLFATSV